MSELSSMAGPTLSVPVPISDPVRLAIHANGDQAQTDERDLGGGITVVLGIRYVYFRAANNRVCCVPVGNWRDAS